MIPCPFSGKARRWETGKLVRWAGKNGRCWYGYKKMAEALGKSVRQVKSDMRVLEEYGLIQHKRRGFRSNMYGFLWHRIFEGDVQNSAGDVQFAARSNVQSAALVGVTAPISKSHGWEESSALRKRSVAAGR